MKKLYQAKKGNMKFWVCKYDCGLYSLDRITKGCGCSLEFAETLEEIETYCNANGYKAS